MNKPIHFNVIVSGLTKKMEIFKLLPRTSYPRCSLIIDMQCPESENVLQQVQDFNGLTRMIIK